MSTEISCGPGERRRKLMGASGDLALMAAYPLDEGINKTPLGRVYNSSAKPLPLPSRSMKRCALLQLRPPCGSNPRNSLKVRREFHFPKACGDHQFTDNRLLRISDFKGNRATRNKRGKRSGNETAIDFEPARAGEESLWRLVIANLDCKRFAVGGG